MTDIPKTLSRASGRGRSGFVSRAVGMALLVFALAFLIPAATAQAGEEADMTAALLKLSKPHEKAGYDFRADIWQRELDTEMGKAVRIQMFKGNEYRVCVAVAPGTGTSISAHVLDFEGKPAEDKVEASEGGWGITLHVKPKRTGVYLMVVRRADTEKRKAVCGMITGYR